jgi:AraC-like DNA-binding protein
MNYKQTKPHSALANYIDAYWTAAGDSEEIVQEKILPDGCVDIILSFGDDCKTDRNRFNIKNGKAYLVGTMSHFKMIEMSPGARLFGIRFKPAAFSAFYRFTSLDQVTDTTIEFEEKPVPDLNKIILDSSRYLDRFFLNRLTQPIHMLLPVVADIENNRGQVTVNELAKRHFITTRQLERGFKQYIGVSPKEFINFIRYRSVAPVIQNKSADTSLSDIAFEHGYYDHSHLTNTIKRYTGVSPSQLKYCRFFPKTE